MPSWSPDLVVLDGSNLLWRNAVALKGLGFSQDGRFVYTGGAYGFYTTVAALIRRWPAADLWVAWEGGGTATRRKTIPDYKVRKPDPRREDLWERVKPQYGLLNESLSATFLTQIVAKGWEADDAMATVARSGSRAGLDVVIVTSDKDLLQCLKQESPEDGSGWVRILAPIGNGAFRQWDDEILEMEWGVTPAQVPDVKALAGDPSDGYRGAEGIGITWACRLIKEFGCVEGVIAAAQEGFLTKAKGRAVVSGEAYIRDCLTVATVCDTARTKRNLGKPDRLWLKSRFLEWGFTSLASNDQLMKELTTCR